jgi:hypothetical protein
VERVANPGAVGLALPLLLQGLVLKSTVAALAGAAIAMLATLIAVKMPAESAECRLNEAVVIRFLVLSGGLAKWR